MRTGKFVEILTPYSLSAFGADLPGDGMKRNPERENSAMQPNASPFNSFPGHVYFRHPVQY